MEEGVIAKWLTNPVRILGNEAGWVTGMEVVEMELGEKSLKSQMKTADRLGAAHVLMIGETELGDRAALLRNMQTKEQVRVPFDGLMERIKAILNAR